MEEREREKLTSKVLASWNRGFGSRQEDGHLSLVNVVCCAGKGLCDGPLTRPE
jgi:hypothetical protein